MTLAYGAVGSIVYSQTDPAPAYPTGGTASRKYGYALYITSKPDTAVSDQAELEAAGWTFLGAFSGGSGSTGADAGPMRVGVYWRESDTILSGTVSQITIPNNSVSSAHIERWECATNEGFDVAITGGVDSSTGSPYTVVTSSVPQDFVKTGDGLSFLTSFPSDTTTSPVTWGTPTLTAQGGGTINLGTITQRVALTSTTGNDLGGRHATAMPTVSTQQQSGTLTFSSTLTGTTTRAAGPTSILRVRALTPPSTPTAAPAVSAGEELINVTTPALSTSTGATSFDVYDNQSTRVGFQIAPNTTIQASVNPGFPRSFTVRGVNSLGQSASGPASASIESNPTPPAFTLKGESDTGGKVDVTITPRFYTAVYKIYRNGSLVHTSSSMGGGADYVWTDTGVTDGVSYDYTVATEVGPPTRISGFSPIQTVTPMTKVVLNILYLHSFLPAYSGDQRVIDALVALGHSVTSIAAVASPIESSDNYDLAIMGQLLSSASIVSAYADWAKGLAILGTPWLQAYISDLAVSNSGSNGASVNLDLSVPFPPNQGRSNPFALFGGPQGHSGVPEANLGPEAMVVARHVSVANFAEVVAYDAGDDMASGHVAPARRVAFGNYAIASMIAGGVNWLVEALLWAGEVLPPPAAAIAPVKIWNGSAWVEAPAKIYNGSAWVVAPVKIP